MTNFKIGLCPAWTHCDPVESSNCNSMNNEAPIPQPEITLHRSTRPMSAPQRLDL